MEGEGKSLGRLIHNLQSDPDIQAAIKAKTVHETAKEAGLRMLRERVARLDNLLTLDSTPHLLIANEITMIVEAAALYCPRTMGEALLQSMHDSICQEKGFCIKCGVFIPDRKPDDLPWCADCTKKSEAREKAMDEQQPGQ